MSDPGLRVAVLADLGETITPDAVGEYAAFTHDLLVALAQLAEAVGGLHIDVVARRGTPRILPTIAVEPDELGTEIPDPVYLHGRQELAYTHLFLAGMLDGYDIVHCIAPLVTPMLLMVGARRVVVQTVTAALPHPSVTLPAGVLPKQRFRRVEVGHGHHPLERIPVPTDLLRYQLADQARADIALWCGSGGDDGRVLAQQVADALGWELVVPRDGDLAEKLSRARVLLHMDREARPLGSVWPLRALACGTPVAGWMGGGLETLLDPDAPALGAIAPLGDTRGLSRAIAALRLDRAAMARRRELPVLRHGPRGIAARYREIYRSLADRMRG